MPRSRPGVDLLDEERYAVLLGDAIDGLESFQPLHPHQGIEDIVSTIRLVRTRLLARAADRLGYLEQKVADPFPEY